MAMPVALLVFSALWGRSEAQSGNASAVSVVEQYCFPRLGAPFSTNTLQPSVTMMYSGMTLTTAPLTLTVSGTGLSIDSPGGCANSATVSRLTDASPLPDTTETRANSASESLGSALTLSMTTPSSLASEASDGSQAIGSVLETSSARATTTTAPNLAVGGNAGSVIGSTVSLSTSGISSNSQPAIRPGASDMIGNDQPAVSPGASGVNGNGQSVVVPSASETDGNDQLISNTAPSVQPTGLSTGTNKISASAATTAMSNPPGVSSLAGLSPSSTPLTQTHISSNTTSLAGAQVSASVGLYRPTGGLLGPDASQQNRTVSLSPSSVNALKLALFLKNLNAWVFNESRIVELSSLGVREDKARLVSLVADIAVQEQTQLRTLRNLLLQSGNPDVPPCQYDLPSNITELSHLMATLKSINLGVFMSMAEAADGPVAILLSSIASVDAKHIALLGDFSHRNASAQPFDTPATPAWAYNIALEYSRPGSCSVQLPLPILPKLTINKLTSGYVQPGANVSVEWGTATKFAFDQVGDRAFVAWVNQVAQPIFTALTLFNENSGSTMVPYGLSGTAFAVLTTQSELTSIADLTAATLAGPVVVSSQH